MIYEYNANAIAIAIVINPKLTIQLTGGLLITFYEVNLSHTSGHAWYNFPIWAQGKGSSRGREGRIKKGGLSERGGAGGKERRPGSARLVEVGE